MRRVLLLWWLRGSHRGLRLHGEVLVVPQQLRVVGRSAANLGRALLVHDGHGRRPEHGDLQYETTRSAILLAPPPLARW